MYAKLFTSIYQGTLRGNSHGLLVFTNLLAHCDKDGCVDMHPRAIAEEVGLSVDQVRAALLTLEAPDPESRSPEEDGRRIVRMDEHRDWGWCVVNYVKYRAIRSEDDRREQNRLAQERWRNKNKPASAEGKQDKPIQKQKQIQKQEEDSVAKATDGKPASEKRKSKDPADMTKEELWAAGKSILQAGGVPAAQCGSFVGKLVKDYGDATVIEAVRAAVVTNPADPREYLKATCQRLKGERKDPVTVPSDAAEKTAALLRQQEEHARHSVAPPANIRALVRKMTGVA